ncbi:MAG: ABC transporter ATP-binding protein [Pseudomonadota bacterium]
MNTSAQPAPSLRQPSALKTIWLLSGDQQKVLLRSVLFKALQAACEAAPAAVLVYIIIELRAGGIAPSTLIIAASIVLLCVLGQWLAGFAANRSAWIATFELFGTLRARLLNHVRRLPMSFHDREKTGNVVTVLTQDVSAVESFTHEPLQMMIGAAVAPFVVFAVLAFQDLPMAVATVTSVVLALPVFLWTNRVFMRLASKRQALQADASSRIIEYVQGLAVIRSFGLAGQRLDRFRQTLDAFRSVNGEMAQKLAPLGSLFLSVVFLGIPLVLFSGTYWFLGGQLDAAVFLIFAILSLRVYLPLIAASQGFESLRIADASLDRIAALMDHPLDPTPTQSGQPPANYDISFDQVSFAYSDGEPVLRNLSFKAPQGAVTAIVGPSGAGKSTILQLIAGLRRPDTGEIRIGAVNQEQLTHTQLFDAVTPVFQDIYLFPGTIYENIAFGREDAPREAVMRAARQAQVHAFADQLPDGYETQLQEAGSNLSGGERQRIAIARAILKNAPIILLDEVTSALDATNERRVQEALAALVADKTVIVTAHRLSTIRNADNIVVVQDGGVVQSGQHDKLLAEAGLYQRLWKAREAAANWTLR